MQRFSGPADCHNWIPLADSTCLPLHPLEGNRHLRLGEKERHFLCPLTVDGVSNRLPCLWCRALLVLSDGLPLDPHEELTLGCLLLLDGESGNTGRLLPLGKGTSGPLLFCCSSSAGVSNRFAFLFPSSPPLAVFCVISIDHCCVNGKPGRGMVLYLLVLSQLNAHFCLVLCLPHFTMSSLRKVWGFYLSVCLHLACSKHSINVELINSHFYIWTDKGEKKYFVY